LDVERLLSLPAVAGEKLSDLDGCFFRKTADHEQEQESEP
jgi:hypothetical protein